MDTEFFGEYMKENPHPVNGGTLMINDESYEDKESSEQKTLNDAMSLYLEYLKHKYRKEVDRVKFSQEHNILKINELDLQINSCLDLMVRFKRTGRIGSFFEIKIGNPTCVYLYLIICIISLLVGMVFNAF